MGRKILFVTTDQQRYDTLGCNGGTLARTPVIDSLAAQGIRYERAVPQSVVCMPSRSTMLTGQHPSTHGVWMNGVPLPVDAPSVAALLNDQGYRTALVGKPHFEPFIDPFGRFTENRLASSGAPTAQTRHFDGTIGPHRGFEHLEFATHGAAGWLHYSQWIGANHPEAAQMFYAVLDSDLEVNSAGFGDTGGPQVKHNPIPKDWYHTDWVADRTIDWLDSLDDDDDFFCWMSFPDPHHPWDPPESEIGRTTGAMSTACRHPTTERSVRPSSTASSPLAQCMTALVSNYEAPTHWVPETLTADQLRDHRTQRRRGELIDEAPAGSRSRRPACSDDLDVVFTTDDGELGRLRLLFKARTTSTAHVLPWSGAGAVGRRRAWGHRAGRPVDLALTFTIGGLDAGVDAGRPWDGDVDAAERGFERCSRWDRAVGWRHLRTITRDRMVHRH